MSEPRVLVIDDEAGLRHTLLLILRDEGYRVSVADDGESGLRAALGPGGGRLTLRSSLERYQPDRPIPVRRAGDPPGVSYAHLRRPRYTSARESPIEPGTEVVRVVVADTGPGIPPEHIDTIFDPFFTTRPPGEGTGLGLAIVASTVADFGGRIEASSAQGGGAAFTLILPTYRAEP